jgi:hypothetical protein
MDFNILLNNFHVLPKWQLMVFLAYILLNGEMAS